MARSRILKEMHENVKGLYEAGLVTEITMRNFDTMCLPPANTLTPEEIRQLRESNHLSQSVFAAYLNTSPSTVRQWESGAKHPAGIALRFLNLIQQKGLHTLFG